MDTIARQPVSNQKTEIFPVILNLSLIYYANLAVPVERTAYLLQFVFNPMTQELCSGVIEP